MGGLSLGLLGESQVLCDCSWNVQVKFLCLFLLLTIPLYLCIYIYMYIYIHVHTNIYLRMYNEQVYIVPCLAPNLSACKGNLPVRRYKHAGRVSMSNVIPQELQQVTKS